MRFLLVFALLALTGCGGSDGTAACAPLTGSCSRTGSASLCTEYGNVPAAAVPQLMSECTTPDPDGPSVWSARGCSHAGSIGACRRTEQGVCVAVWLYGAGSLAESRSVCAGVGGTWVDP